MTTSELIGVIGATGKTGSRIADRLERDGHAVRRLARGTSPGFDWTAPAGWLDALRGVRRLYVAYVPDLAQPGSDADISRLLETARAAGVGRVVLLSGRGEAAARVAEDLVLGSGIDATIVRAAWFSQNFTEGDLADMVRAGVIAMAAGQCREPFVDVDDVADVAVAALTENGHAGQVYEVTGPELLTFADAAQILAEARAHAVEYVPLSFEEFHVAIADAMGPEAADLLTGLCREVFDGRNESLADGVRRALGREPRSLREVVSATVVS
jgi:uncharacterized protein YbjT (DUF2867 family)